MRKQHMELRGGFQNSRGEYHLEISGYLVPVNLTDTAYVGLHAYTLHIKYEFIAHFNINALRKTFFGRYGDILAGLSFSFPFAGRYLFRRGERIPVGNAVLPVKCALGNVQR